jgi:hypothetical protein
MATPSTQYFPIASACNQSEAIRIRMLLDRVCVPYRERYANLYSLYGDAAAVFAGPMQFLIPAELKEQAEERIMDLFTIDPQNLPSQCPACESKVPQGACDCPNCGLFLG